MSWWKRIVGGTPSRPLEFPHRIQLDSSLSVTVFEHDIEARQGKVQCWSFVTEGLVRNKQDEMVFTIKRGKKEAPADFPRHRAG